MTLVIEGTWEEIKLHDEEFAGRRLTVIVSDNSDARSQDKMAHVPVRPRRVSAMGKYAGILSSEEFMRHKQVEIDIEERVRE